MRSKWAPQPLAAAMILTMLFGCGPSVEEHSQVHDPANPVVVLDTTAGVIELELFPSLAPRTVANFLEYVDSGFYNNMIFHRVLADYVIQTGAFEPDLRRKSGIRDAVVNEAENRLRHKPGTVAMARGLHHHSARNEFFINLEYNKSLNHIPGDMFQVGYTIFGKVITGMDVVVAIGQEEARETERFESLPFKPVIVKRTYRKGAPPPAPAGSPPAAKKIEQKELAPTAPVADEAQGKP